MSQSKQYSPTIFSMHKNKTTIPDTNIIKKKLQPQSAPPVSKDEFESKYWTAQPDMQSITNIFITDQYEESDGYYEDFCRVKIGKIYFNKIT